MKRLVFMCPALGLLLSAPAWAVTMLFDFEVEAEAKAWHDEGRSSNSSFPVSRETRYATSGASALCFRSPQWKPGMGEWPACEGQPTVADWSGHDRLYFAVTNPTAYEQQLLVFISDSKIATRDGVMVRARLAPYSFQQVVQPLAELSAKGLNLADMRVIHFFTERPPGDMEVYLDQVCLLRPDEALPEAPASFLKQYAPLQAAAVTVMREQLARTSAEVRDAAGDAPEVAAWANAALAELDQQVRAFADQVASGDARVLQAPLNAAKLQARLARLGQLARFRAEFARVRPGVQVGGAPPADLAVGFATSMEKVLPRAGQVPPRVARRVSLALARNEEEALQVLVMPFGAGAQAVEVRSGDLRSASGAVLVARQIECAPMGYVETKTVPPYGSSHVGWWPDPILDFLGPVDIAAEDLQSFWVRVRAPKDQAPERYRGKLEVVVSGKPVYAFDFTVEVYPFTMPDRSPLPMAVTFAPMFYEPNGSGGWQEGGYRDTSWQKHKQEWGDFLADHYLMHDSLYHRGQPEFPVLQRQHELGRLDMFNLGYYQLMPDDPAEAAKWKEDIEGRIGPAYRRARELGILDHAYIYGCDEHPEALFPAVERAAAFLRERYPGALILTTTYDHSFGTNSVLQSMDGFCPLTPSYKRDLADRVRATGKQVWWYICCGPHHPYANMFIEYPAIEGRVLMGAQAAKHRPDGFLYYEISIWNGKPITSGPFTDYDPRSWTTYHGDGSWTCPGPDGAPLTTIRLENFRDGVEDYAYARLLEQAVARVKSTGQAGREEWLARARALLEVPESVTRSMTEYTRDPADVYRWRRGMAEAIKSSGVEISLD